MKILLVGEYSRLHNSLREGLMALGHEATIISTGDGFKGYESQYSVEPKLFKGLLLKKFKNLTYKLTGINMERTEKGLRFMLLLPRLKGYSHVQLINSDALETHPWLAKILLKKLFSQNGSVSLLICGDEPPIIDYALSGKLKYSILTPYLQDKSLKKYFSYSLKFVKNNHRKLFAWLVSRSQSIITSDLDYELPMKAMGFTTHFIPNPVNTDTLKPIATDNLGKVIIFLGINRGSYIKKGIVYFEQALNIIRDKYADKAEIIITENIPYAEYISIYNRAHILLDQVYAYDQGYNALEAMAKGKVVFTGAETEFETHFKLSERVNVNALPDVDNLVKELSHLIENPSEITEIQKRARLFIEKEHHYVTIAGQYLKAWQL